MNIYKSHIVELNNKRKKYLKLYEDSYDFKLIDYTIDEPTEIDEIGDEIIKNLFNNNEYLDVDFIIEILTHLGLAPNILYDNNGHFAIADDGTQSINFNGPENTELSFYVKKEYWFDNIRESLNNYLKELNPELWLKIKRKKKLKRIIKT